MGLGKVVKILQPSAENCRNSEGAFIETQTGSIVFVYSRYTAGRGEDHDPADLALIESFDGGKTFSEPRVIITAKNSGGTNIMSVSLLRLQNGATGVFYLKKDAQLNCRMFMRQTRDFIHFSDEMQCINERGYFVVNNDRVIRLASGDILIPAAWHPTKEEYAIAQFYISKDDGKTFSLVSSLKAPHEIIYTGFQEPGVIELDDRTLLAYFRNNSGRQYTAYSYDGANSWTQPQPSEFTSPISPMSMKYTGGDILAVYNPAPLYYGRGDFYNGIWTGGRNPLIGRISRDKGKTFEEPFIIENDESRGFCYCAIYPVTDGVLLAYCSGGKEEGGILHSTTIRKLEKNELK